MLKLKVILNLMFAHAVVASNMGRMKIIKTGLTVSWLNMKRYPNRVLDVAPIAAYSTTSKEKCGSVCLKTPACKSLNLKQESASQYQCDLLDTTMFETNCKFIWNETASHYEFVSNCTTNYSICKDPLKICVPNDDFTSYTCKQKQHVQLHQAQFCSANYNYNTTNVAWEFPYCGFCRETGSVYILLNKYNSIYNRTWEEYKNGFGNPGTMDYWIGLEMLQKLTNPPVLLVAYCATGDTGTGNTYHNFTVSSESDFYRMSVAGKDKFVQYHNGKTFSTFDGGNNQEKARVHGSGWWYGDVESGTWFNKYMKPNTTLHDGETCTLVTVRIKRYMKK